MRILYLCLLCIVLMSSCVIASQSYAQAHPMDGLQLKMMYCIDMQRYEGQPIQDVGCKVGHGNGKVGVKKDIVKKLVARMNIYKDSYEYTQLVSREGLKMVFHDGSVGSKGSARVWQDGKGKLYMVFGKEE